MRSPGICTWERAGEACHEFHRCGHNREEKGKFLNTIVQVSLFPTTSQDIILFCTSVSLCRLITFRARRTSMIAIE